MEATITNVKNTITSLDLPAAVDPKVWDITEEGNIITAANRYHVVDRLGLYDAYKKFRFEWTTGGDILSFKLTFDAEIYDSGVDGLRAHMETIFIDRMLEESFGLSF